MSDGFVSAIDIRTTPERLWAALTEPDVTEAYWFGTRVESSWVVGDLVLFRADTRVTDKGQVLAVEPFTRLSYSLSTTDQEQWGWQADSRILFTLDPHGDSVRLTVRHDGLPKESPRQSTVPKGWPVILTGLKGLLEVDARVAV